MEASSQLTDSIYQLWSSFVSGDGFTLFSSFCVFGGAILGFIICLGLVLLADLCDIVHAAVPLVSRFINDRKAKKSGKLTNEQRLELLEEKIYSLADIVISSSPEEK